MRSTWSSHFSPSTVDRAAISPDGKYLVVITEESLFLYHLQTGEANEVDIPAISTCVSWVDQDTFCVGFESGDLLAIDANEGTSAEYKFLDAPIQSLRVLQPQLAAVDGPSLWLLYDGGQVIVVSTYLLFEGYEAEPVYQFKLIESTEVNDLLLLPVFTPRIYSLSGHECNNSEATHSLVVSGTNPCLSIFNIGGSQHFQHIGKLAGYVKAKVSALISKSISALYRRVVSSSETPASQQPSVLPITSLADFNDEKRRILRMSIDPQNKFIAAADTVGRVLLFDRRLLCAVRVWKGLRDAKVAWVHSERLSARLAIYSPRIGVVQVFALVHGPCLKSIPVGLNCHLLPVHSKELLRSAYGSAGAGLLQAFLVLRTASQRIELVALRELSSAWRAGEAGGCPGEPTSEAEDECTYMYTLKKITREYLLTTSEIKDSADRPLLEQLVGALESTLLAVIHSITGPIVLQSCLDYISSCERSSSLEFSAGFHRGLAAACRTMLARDSTTQMKEWRGLVVEVEFREHALGVYESLRSLWVDPEGEEAAAFTHESLGQDLQAASDQNTCRAEALCWALHAARKQAAVESSRSKPRSPDRSASISPAAVRSIRDRQRTNSSESLSSADSQEQNACDANSTAETSAGKIPQRIESSPPSFTLFCSYLAAPRHDDTTGSHAPLVLDSKKLLEDLRSCPSSSCLSLFQLPTQPGSPCQTETETLSQISVSAQRVLRLVTGPLFGDTFSISPHRAALRRLGLDGGVGLVKLLPLALRTMELSSWGGLILTTLSKPLAACTLQKFIREVLLEFQEFLHSDCDEDGCTDGAMQTLLMRDIMSARRFSGQVDSEDQEETTSDETTRHLLCPAWMAVRNSPHLEAGMAMAAAIHEVLSYVHEHLEKKSYGRVTLQSSLQSWRVLILQLRVVLLLRSRSEAIVKGVHSMHAGIYLPLTVGLLDRGDVSVFAMLSADTLCFAMQQEQAVQHEIKCKEVYLKKAASSQESMHSAEPLLAWAADRRWREIIGIVAAEELESSDPSSPRARSRRPLLLYFPIHNMPETLGAYRSAWLMRRWAASPGRTELLQLSVSHLSQLSPLLRAAVADGLYRALLLPLLAGYLLVEEGVAPGHQPAEAAVGKFSLAVTDPKTVQEFVRCSLDLLDFAAVAVVPGRQRSLSEMLSSGTVAQTLGEPVDVYYSDIYLSRGQKTQVEVWPGTSDLRLEEVVATFCERGGRDVVTVDGHRALLVAVQLRTQHSLRRFALGSLFALPTDALCRGDVYSSLARSDCREAVARSGFIKECFKATRSEPSALTYQLASLWAIDIETARFVQISAYLDVGLNEQIEAMVNLVGDRNRLIDEVVQAVRVRIGNTITHMDPIPDFSAVLVSMEAVASTWCRASVGKADAAEVDLVAKGLRAAVDFDLVGTRHLIIRMQALLLAVPAQSGERDSVWKERKEKCDDLLALCGNLVPAQNRFRMY